MAAAEVPPEVVLPAKPPPPKKAYIAATGAIDTVSYRLSPALLEPSPSGTRRSDFVGVTVGLRAGYMLAKTFALEADASVGALGAKYKINASDALESTTTVAHLELMPMARFVAPGKVRFTAATGVGVERLGVESKIAQPGSTLTKTGGGFGATWAAEAGMQAEVGAVFLEIALFLNVHGVGGVTDDAGTGSRLLYASPATRGGLRLGLGLPF
jgi:hypothetical protein